MSEDFSKRLQEIRAAYSEKRNAEKAFKAAWHRISKEVVWPVLKTAKSGLASSELSLSVDEDEDGSIGLTLITIPVPKSRSSKLSFRPRTHARDISVTSDFGTGEPSRQQIALDDISTDLIESHVEDFLKGALRLKP